MEMQLISDKLTIPSQLTHRINRAKLLAILNNSIITKLATLVVGRAGTGKTSLVADFARQCGRPVAWYKTEASDNEWSVFYEYLVESIKRQRQTFNAERLLESVASQLPTESPLAAEAVVNQLLEDDEEPLLVVLDDLHRIYDAKWFLPFFGRLLPLLPINVHFILIGRSLPPAPLWRMRSKQTLTVIDERMLALSPEEAIELFAYYGLPETAAMIAFEQMNGRVGDLNALASFSIERVSIAGCAAYSV